MDFTSREKRKRIDNLRKKLHAKNNYQKTGKQFEDLWEQSGYEDYEIFKDHYLIDLYNRKDSLSKQEFTQKVLDFSLHHDEEIEYELEEPLKEGQYDKYINDIFKLNFKEEYLITSFLERLPFERYLNVVNYFNEILKKKYASFIKNNHQWVDDYDQYQDDIRLINEARFALWDNNPALLNAEYKLGPYE